MIIISFMWKIKIDRPEELYERPGDYYNRKEIEKYAQSKSMRRKQEKLTVRLVELLEISPPLKILDLGCGPGFSTNFLKEMGFSVVGLDMLEDMLKIAIKKGLQVVKGDMKNLAGIFEENSFDCVMSISALQWINIKDMGKVAIGIKKILRKNGKFGAQFYPKSDIQMEKIGKIFSKKGFKGGFVVDNENSPRKRTIYLLLTK